MIYDQLTIYYFSGTGNARNAAQWMIDLAREKGLKTQLINIDRFKTIELPATSQRTLIGFCAPTHGFNVPPIMLKVLSRFPKTKNTDAFILNTRGGLKMGKLFLPGVSGLAQVLPAMILRLKGMRIVGMQPLDLPSNWLLLHPGQRKKVILSIYNRCNRIVAAFAENLINGKGRYKALLSLPLDIALIPIALGYYFVGRFFLAKTLIATDDCNQCGKCIEQCPVSSIRMVNNRPYWSYSCESCMRCVNNCPTRAIETTQTYSGLLAFLSYVIISPLILIAAESLGILDWMKHPSLTKLVSTIIESVVLIGIVVLCYKGLHYLMRFRFVNKVIKYTSLSTYKFWRRYKPPKYNSLK